MSNIQPFVADSEVIHPSCRDATQSRLLKKQQQQLVLLKEPEQKKLMAMDSRWLQASDKQRNIASHKLQLVKLLLSFTDQGASLSKAIKLLSLQWQLDQCTPNIVGAVGILSKKNKLPDKATLYRWIEQYQNQGLTGLLPCHKGSVRIDKGWEAFALNLYATPSKPSMNQVARELRELYNYPSATDSQVRKFINYLPRYMTHDSIQRLGASLVRKTKRDYIRRTSENLPVGCLYQGDGHAIDVYVQHPVSGHIFRPELTVWIDVKSRYIVGWWISEAESSISTITSLGNAIVMHDHIPDCLYVDNGSGFKSKMMNDESFGFYARHDIDVVMALPGNPGAKGQVERFFGTMERDYCKSAFPHAFCGENMSDEAAQKFQRNLKIKSENNPALRAPTVQEWMDGFSTWLDRYHSRPHPEFKHTTPAELWATLEKNPVYLEAAAIFRPRIARKVNRSAVRLHKREYTSQELYDFNGWDVHVEYDLHNDEQVAIVNKDNGSLLCYASLVYKKDHLPASRIEEYKAKRLEGQLKRKQRHIDEDIAKTREAITADAQVKALEQLDSTLTTINLEALDVQADDIEIDFSKTDY